MNPKQKFDKTIVSKKAFTLVELLVVIAIIGLISSITLVSLNYAKKRARDIRRIANLKMICTALEAYYIDHGYYPYVGCSNCSEESPDHYGKYRDFPNDTDKIFDVLQPYLEDIVQPYVPNDPAARYNLNPGNDWSYFYDNYYDKKCPENTPDTYECSDQAFQLLGYLEVETPPFGWVWGTWEGRGWWRACKSYPSD